MHTKKNLKTKTKTNAIFIYQDNEQRFHINIPKKCMMFYTTLPKMLASSFTSSFKKE